MTELRSLDEMVGVVVIGRNEGQRLKTCLESFLTQLSKVVYVDSGSTDNSIELAQSLGVEIVRLDLSTPFSAARARNEGFSRLRDLAPDLPFVQFVDGDCEVVEGWLGLAVEYLDQNPDVAIVCGRRRERYPEASVYNQLCDIEWNTPVGEAKACGGDALMRSDMFGQVGGFNPEVIAGEEPELCIRIRQQCWKVWRLDAEMTLHDANMTRFGQWWKRNIRSGYAYALGADLHGKSPEQHRIRETRRIWLWGAGIPVGILIAGAIYPLSFICFLIYPIQILRIAIKNSQVMSANWTYAFFVTLGKFPETQGQLKFLFDKATKARSAIIEYKN